MPAADAGRDQDRERFMEDWLNQLSARLAYVGPDPMLRAFAVVILFLLLGKFTDLLTAAALNRLMQHWAGAAGEQAAVIGHRTVFRTVALFGLMIATTVIGLPPRPERVVLAVIESALILIWVAACIRAGRMIVLALSGRPAPPAWARPATAPLLNNLLGVVLVLAGAYGILLAWDVNVTGLVASAGIIGLALSFAAQDTLGNLFAGVAILVDQPYRIDDYIVLDTGERGRVTRIGLRSTRILTRDDEEISIPNGIMGKAKIVNESGGPHVKYRLRVPVGVAYGSDIDHVMKVLLDVAAAHRQVCRDPEPRIRLRTFADSSIDFELLVWIAEPALRGLVLHEMNCEIYRAFGREEITIPFPQREVHLRDWRGPAPG
jgi:MscS family membrane protein